MVPANLRCSLELCSDFIIPFRARGQECAHGRDMAGGGKSFKMRN